METKPCARLLRAMGNAKRLRILCLLVDGEVSVGDLAIAVGLVQSALSQHLLILKEENLVTTRREQQRIFYRCDSSAVKKVLRALGFPAEARPLAA